jgi:putative two-component system response regulator
MHDLVFRPGEMPPLFGDTAAVLIVDDDPAVARLLRDILEPEGYDCTITADAAQARKVVADRTFALALVDVLLGGETGLELAADLLRQHPDLAVVMVTGIDDPKIAELAVDMGAYGYLVKPFAVTQVLVTVANAGRRRCLEIERRVYQQRLERRVHEQAADLEEALLQLKQQDE